MDYNMKNLMNKGLLLLTSMLSVAAVCIAQPVSEDQAGRIALQFLDGGDNSMKAPSRGVQTLEVAYTAQTGSDKDFYVFNRQGGGFVIVSADERTAKPVLAYSYEGRFDAENMSPAQEEILSGYRQQIDYARKNMTPAPDVLKNSSPVGTVIVEPLIKTQWNQGEPYNKLCPTVDGRKTYAGCAACAMAQIMNFWRWPERGHGSHRNVLDNTLYVDFNESVYDWDNMALTYTADSSQVKIDAVSKLIYDCGMAVDMDYPINGTYTTLISQALMSYFNYSSQTRRIEKNLTENWDSVIAAELDARRPVLYSGVGESGGHAFICDGYDSEGYFHFNIGWGGAGDGFYLTDAVRGEGLSGFNRDQNVIIGIYPDYDDKCRDGDGVCRLDAEGCAVLYDVIRSTDSIDIIIPDSTVIDGVVYPVQKIADKAFYRNDKYCSKVTIPETVEIIGNLAFYGSQCLSDISIPASVKEIGYAAFSHTNSLKKITVSEKSTFFYSPEGSNVIIETSTGRLVQGCNYSVIPSEGVTAIGENSFDGFDSLTVVILPESVSLIEDDAFADCSNLEIVYMGGGINRIGERVFRGCKILTDVYIDADTPPSMPQGSIPAGCAIHVKESAFSDCMADEVWSTYILVSKVFSYTYKGTTLYYIIDSAVGAVLLPPMWPYFDEDNDESWSGFEKPSGYVVVPDSVPFDGTMHAVTVVAQEAFYKCTEVTSVNLPGSVRTIGNWAFAECSNLQYALLGEGLENIGYCAFRECGNLQYINYPSTLKVIDGFAFQYDSLLSTNLNLPDGFTTLGIVAYGDNQSLTTVQLPGSMEKVPEEVFWGCTSLVKVTLGEGITTIEESAFYDCPSLHELTLPASIDSIGDSVFVGSTRIDRLVFRSSVPPAVANSDSVFNDYHTLLIVPSGSTEAYRAHPFWGLFMNIVEIFPYTHLGTTLYYIVDDDGNASVVPPLYPFSADNDNSANAWGDYTKPTGVVTVPDSVLFNGVMYPVTAVADYAFFECREITDLTLPASVTAMGRNAFALCRALQTVNIPDGVTRLSYGCFQVCSSLKAVDIPASVSHIDEGAFYNCRGLKEVTFHEGLDSIGRLVFCFCISLERITLPEGLRYIGYEAFMRNNSLRHVDLPSTLEVIISNAFRENPLLDSISFPDNLSYFGGGVVMDCPNLTYVHLPENMEVMEGFLLYGTGIETFVVPQNVKTISYQVFAECSRLHKVTLPASVTSLGWGLFDDSPIDTLVLECAVPPTLNEEEDEPTFQEYTATLIVPAGSAEAYRSHPVWGLFKNIVEESETVVRPLQHSLPADIYYDMQGRRLDSRPQGNGLFIRNGKKTVVTDSRP